MNELKTALLATGYPFAHFAWAHAPQGTYGTYGEDGENRLAGDNKTAELSMIVYVSLYTKDDSDQPRVTVEQALEGFAWNLNSVQFEDDTGYIHYEWEVSV